MKKIFSGILCLLLAGVMTFTFTSCGKQNELRVISHGIFPPVVWHESGVVKGIDADMVKIFAQELNKKVRFDIADHTGSLAAVQSGTHDFATCFAPTPARREMVDFTEPYLMSSLMFLTRAGDTRLDSKDKQAIEAAVNGRRVGTVFGSSHHTYIQDVPGAIPVHYENFGTLVIALKNNLIDFILWEFNRTDSGTVILPDVMKNDIGIKLISVPVDGSQNAIAVRKGNTKMLNRLNEIIAQIKADGRLDEIVMKYV